MQHHDKNFSTQAAAAGHCARNRVNRVWARAFTMAEMLVVIAIILIVATLALPAFNVITGAKSVEAGSNVVTALLTQARSEAMSRQQTIGLAVFFDQIQQKSAVALVCFPQPWSNGTQYLRGDLVYTDEGGTRNYWLCSTPHIANAQADSSGLAIDASPQLMYASSQPSWAVFPIASSGTAVPRYDPNLYVSILPETGITYLPGGIGAQVLNSTSIPPSGSGSPTPSDRYLRTGVMFFDSAGRLAPKQQWGTLFDPNDVSPPAMGNTALNTTSTGGTSFRSTRLGLSIRFNTDGAARTMLFSTANSYNLDPIYNASSSAYSTELKGGLGIVLYDRQAYENRQFPAWDGQTTNQPNGLYRESDDWLDQNGTLLLLNRYTGTLLKTD